MVEEVADGPGLVRARVLACLINEAADALFHGVASAAGGLLLLGWLVWMSRRKSAPSPSISPR